MPELAWYDSRDAFALDARRLLNFAVRRSIRGVEGRPQFAGPEADKAGRPR